MLKNIVPLLSAFLLISCGNSSAETSNAVFPQSNISTYEYQETQAKESSCLPGTDCRPWCKENQTPKKDGCQNGSGTGG